MTNARKLDGIDPTGESSPQADSPSSASIRGIGVVRARSALRNPGSLVFLLLRPHVVAGGQHLFLELLEVELQTADVGAPAGARFRVVHGVLDLGLRRAQLVGQGRRNEEIAQRLGKSVLTVKKQLHSIYAKLDAPNRGRLIALLR